MSVMVPLEMIRFGRWVIVDRDFWPDIEFLLVKSQISIAA